MRFDAFDADTQELVVDVGAIFATTDLRRDQQCHSSGTPCPAMFHAVGLDWDSGLPMQTQAAFRVE